MNCSFPWGVFSILVGRITCLVSGIVRFCRKSCYRAIGMFNVCVPLGLNSFVWGKLSWQFRSCIWRPAVIGSSVVLVGYLLERVLSVIGRLVW